MYVTTDAQIYEFLSSEIAQTHITMDILDRIEDDLDLEEKFSILFLMLTDYESSFYEILELFDKARTEKVYILKQFVNRYSHNWQNKLLEAICICNNQKVVRKLGIPFKCLEARYILDNRLYSENLSFVAKCLYTLCESLSKEEAAKLIKEVRESQKVYEPKLDDVDQLELHILYWIHIKYINVSLGKHCNLQNLLKHLKEFDDITTAYTNLKLCETQCTKLDDVSGAGNDAETSAVKPGICVESQITGARMNAVHTQVQNVTKGLCVIVNQMFFSGQQYDTRYGTTADCTRLSETFKGIGFNVHVVENLTGEKLLKKIESIPKEFGSDYDCVFLCILSHGCKGSVIASDEVEISIEQIEQKICCKELRNVIKIVIIQACQGNITGQMNENQSLATDGLSDKRVLDITAYKNFGIFMSTMQGCVSVRHKAEGSWFIQEFCNIIEKNDNNTTFFHIVMKVVQIVQSKRGVMDGTYSVAQLPELRMWRLETDFQLPKYLPPNQ